jgi:plastocyanin
MRIKAFVILALLSLVPVACDDADPVRPRDGGSDARRDGGADARDGATDRTPDTVASGSDAPAADAPRIDAPTPDTAPSPDTQTPDGGTPDTAPALDTAAEASPDTSLDTAVTVDTAPIEPDAALTPDTSTSPDAQSFVVMNGCETEDQFQEDDSLGDPFPMDWADVHDEPICYKVRVGQEVLWAVGTLAGHEMETFATHPVEQFPPGNGEIDGKDDPDQEDYSEEFDTPGTFGFRCTIHSDMRGAIWVVP